MKKLEKAIEKGLVQGKIHGAIAAYRDLDFQEDMILEKLQITFLLSKEEAKEYLQGLK